MTTYATYYILDADKNLVPVKDILEWKIWLVGNDPTVAKHTIEGRTITTVFLGFNRNYGPGEPSLFETSVQGEGGALLPQAMHYSTWNAAIAGHAQMCEKMKQYEGAC